MIWIIKLLVINFLLACLFGTGIFLLIADVFNIGQFGDSTNWGYLASGVFLITLASGFWLFELKIFIGKWITQDELNVAKDLDKNIKFRIPKKDDDKI